MNKYLPDGLARYHKARYGVHSKGELKARDLAVVSKIIPTLRVRPAARPA
ncbi:hypothetical protein [Actinomadura sp. HBU206391]|nr:hypothetical protein [Actinomadura sp. HBU206391]MBC6462663.1 hypothetical protein [Actinomadura sp. HBU206391]